MPWSFFLVCQQLLPGEGGFDINNELIIPAPPPPLLFYFQTWSACKERRKRRNNGLKPRLRGDNKPIHDLSFPQLPQVATSEKHHHQNMKRSKQRTRHSSIPLFVTTRFCTLGAPPPPLLCLCLCVSLHTTDFCQTVFRTRFRHTSNNHLLLLLTASSRTKPEALVD